MKNAPIGIFDSGVGGLTVVRAIHDLLPQEDLIYVGDTARFPYGNKSPATIIRYAQQITEFLQKQGVKLVVVACNTATVHGLAALREQWALPVLGVVQPGVDAALEATRSGRVGIIGTVGTIQSKAYQQALLQARPELHITASATPLLVSLVEEDWLQHAATQLILEEYLAPHRAAQVDTLVLGCTHYPLLKGLIGQMLGPEVALVDSAENMARAVAERLRQDDLGHSNSKRVGTIQIYASDLSTQFANLAHRFLGREAGTIEKVVLTD
jgi:glutamate racemase